MFLPKPFYAYIHPGPGIGVIQHSKTMASLLIQVYFNRDMMFFKSFCKYQTVRIRDRVIIFCMHEKSWRGLIRNLHFIGEFIYFFRGRTGTEQVVCRSLMRNRGFKADYRVNKDEKIRA